ncbi:MAG: SusC/RagA family TonB-linked outer membrane protein [Rikenellaceae bacterium]
MKHILKYYSLVALLFVSHTTATSQIVETANNTRSHVLSYDSMYSGSATVITGDQLAAMPTSSLSNALAGLAAGLSVTEQSGDLGSASAQFSIRGFGSANGNAVVTYVDGVKRSLDDLQPEQIDRIYIIKDAADKILLGLDAINGAIWVVTKRGIPSGQDLTVTAESGVKMVGTMPNYLNSYDYATLYNEARANDGLSAFYSAQDLEGYRSGSDIQRYPDNDYWNDYFNNYSNYNRISVEARGGNNGLRYYVNLGYLGEGGYERVGEESAFHRLNVRSNLDVKLNSMITFRGDIASSFEFYRGGGTSYTKIFSAISTHRPNEYPIYLSDLRGDDAEYGASILYNNNLVGLLSQTGYVRDNSRSTQMNFGVDFNLNSLLEGLSASAFYGFERYSWVSYGKSENFSAYLPSYSYDEESEVWTTSTGYKQRTASVEGDQSRLGNSMSGEVTARAAINYDRIFGYKHHLVTNIYGVYYESTFKESAYDLGTMNMNYALNLSYSFDNRYSATINAGYFGSPVFEKGERFELFPSISLGWRLSREDFLAGASFIDDLYLTASAAETGTDSNFVNYYLYRAAYQSGDDVSFGENLSTSIESYNQSQVASEDLRYERSREYNVGLAGVLLGGKLTFDVDLFQALRSDILTQRYSLYSDGAIVPYVNYGTIESYGVDFAISHTHSIGAVGYSVGVNGSFARSQYLELEEPNYPDGVNLSMVGRSTDAIMGYNALGLFYDATQAALSPTQTFGYYTAGDIMYQDTNGDGVVDQQDIVEIGNSTPKFTFGFNTSINYKGFELYARFTGALGYDIMLDNDLYQNYGEGKYSEVVLGRWTEATRDTATYPRLTTQSGGNNFDQLSSYWLVSGDYLKLKCLELSYSFSTQVVKKIGLDRLKVFLRGTNIFTLSHLTQSDPEDLTAGYTSYPLYSTYTCGLDIRF